MFSKLSALLVCSLAAVSALAAPPVRRQIQLGGNAGGGGVGTREISELLPGVSGHGGHADSIGNVAGHLTGIINGGLAGAAGGAIGRRPCRRSRWECD
ncbi:hypothetical protein NP233_g10651 [Leucocoprinus birnbaumii]|uniref:Uncharacterized protein n=1 Tax=Leucocoprinus birnbaumii TaxID=56174 RepID=A0AAD5VIE0_9AGAR|nr:hypothetical protein NP233_g10651 [Leucocoprinus birnbaumii]